MYLTIAFVFNVVISSCIIYYLKRLETIGCKCALNFKHDYIFYFTLNINFKISNNDYTYYLQDKDNLEKLSHKYFNNHLNLPHKYYSSYMIKNLNIFTVQIFTYIFVFQRIF